jgi:hypothetical protein
MQSLNSNDFRMCSEGDSKHAVCCLITALLPNTGKSQTKGLEKENPLGYDYIVTPNDCHS